MDERDYMSLHPHADKQAILETIRFASIFIFLVDAACKVGYYESSKFASYHIRDMYFMVLIARPVFIAVYHSTQMLFNVQQVCLEHGQNKKHFDAEFEIMTAAR